MDYNVLPKLEGSVRDVIIAEQLRCELFNHAEGDAAAMGMAMDIAVRRRSAAWWIKHRRDPIGMCLDVAKEWAKATLFNGTDEEALAAWSNSFEGGE